MEQELWLITYQWHVLKSGFTSMHVQLRRRCKIIGLQGSNVL